LKEAVAVAPQDGSLQSWQDVKAYIEGFAQTESSVRVPVGMDLVENNGMVGGFRFYYADEPAERTSGKHLIANLKEAGANPKLPDNYFTPSVLAEAMGLDTQLDIDETVGLPPALDLDLGETADWNGSDGADDADLQEEPLINGRNQLRSTDQPAVLPKHSTPSPQPEDEDLGLIDQAIAVEGTPSSAAQKSQRQSSQPSSDAQRRPPSQPSADSQRRSSSQPQSRTGRLAQEMLLATDQATASMAAGGGPMDGMNVMGATGRMANSVAALGALAVGAVHGAIQDARLKARLQRVARGAHQQAMRIDTLGERAEALLDEPDAVEPIAPMPSVQPLQNQPRSPQAQIPDAPLAEAMTVMGEQVNRVQQAIDPSLEPLQPVRFNSKASIEDRLTALEEYLEKLSKRLDRLEQSMSRLEEQMAAQSMQSVPIDHATETAQPEVNPEQQDCANHLHRYALTLAAEGHSIDTVPLSPTKTLQVGYDEASGINLRVTGSDEETLSKQEIFTATLPDSEIEQGIGFGQWQVTQDTLSLGDKQAILALPQTPEHYHQLATAQSLVEQFVQGSPEAFADPRSSAFGWAEDGHLKYEFEREAVQPDGSRLLAGYIADTSDRVFLARLEPDRPSAILECQIPTAEMESLLNAQAHEARPTEPVDQGDRPKQVRRQQQPSPRPRQPTPQL
jgi:phage shock protein A